MQIELGEHNDNGLHTASQSSPYSLQCSRRRRRDRCKQSSAILLTLRMREFSHFANRIAAYMRRGTAFMPSTKSSKNLSIELRFCQTSGSNVFAKWMEMSLVDFDWPKPNLDDLQTNSRLAINSRLHYITAILYVVSKHLTESIETSH